MKKVNYKQKEWKDMTLQERREIKMVLFTVFGFSVGWITTNFLAALGFVLVGWSIYFVVKIFTNKGAKKRFSAAAIAVLMFIIGGSVVPNEQTDVNEPAADIQSVQQSQDEGRIEKLSESKEAEKAPEEVKKIEKAACDGTAITSNCYVDDVKYETYTYHEAVAEVSHNVETTTYRDEISDYCTLCIDGTYSPSCATGRGACSHHGGVA